MAEARSWKGTPYELHGRVKGEGADCGTYLAEVLIASELVTREEMDRLFEEIGFYGHDWFCHSTSDPRRYLPRDDAQRQAADGGRGLSVDEDGTGEPGALEGGRLPALQPWRHCHQVASGDALHRR